jgi:hypothetical protein
MPSYTTTKISFAIREQAGSGSAGVRMLVAIDLFEPQTIGKPLLGGDSTREVSIFFCQSCRRAFHPSE